MEIGGNLAAHLAMLRQAGLSYRKLSSFCTEPLGIPLTPSGAMGVVNRVTNNTPLYETIGNVLPEQEVLNCDETGWKVRLEQWFVWIFCNPSLVYLVPDKSRSGKVPERILVKDYQGTAICDFHGGYNFLQDKQRCLVHFTRDIEKERDLLPGSVTLERFEDTPGVEWHNNGAERHLRPLVVSRKMSFGSDTPQGAGRTCVLHSVVETCRLQNIRAVDLLREIMTRNNNGNFPLNQILTTRLNC